MFLKQRFPLIQRYSWFQW